VAIGTKAFASLLLMASVALAQDKSLTPEFRKEAWRALDAVMRVDFTLNVDNYNNEQKELLSAAEKAIDEAKYKRITKADQEIFRKLNGFYFGLSMQKHFTAGELLNNNPYFQLHSQCEAELLLYFEPEKMDQEGVKKAKQQTCAKKAEDILKAVVQPSS
jgi:hypothetical protein